MDQANQCCLTCATNCFTETVEDNSSILSNFDRQIIVPAMSELVTAESEAMLKPGGMCLRMLYSLLANSQSVQLPGKLSMHQIMVPSGAKKEEEEKGGTRASSQPTVIVCVLQQASRGFVDAQIEAIH